MDYTGLSKRWQNAILIRQGCRPLDGESWDTLGGIYLRLHMHCKNKKGVLCLHAVPLPLRVEFKLYFGQSFLF